MKISESISSGEFDVNIGDGTYTCEPFTLQTICELEEHGVNWLKIGEYLESSPVVGNVNLMWAALTDDCKARIGSVKEFRQSIPMSAFPELVAAISEVFAKSSPPQEPLEAEKKIGKAVKKA